MKTLVVVVATLLVPSVAAAHIQLSYPPARTTEQKSRPCGPANSTRGTNVTVLEPGATIEVMWNETINHPGHFRISFDPDGQDFSFPPDATSDTGLTDPLVLKDLIPDVQGGVTSFTVTLPDIECDNCTLQVIQLMTDKPPYTVDANSNDLYFQCADIKLERTGGGGDAGGDDSTDGTTDDTTDNTDDTTDTTDGTTPTDVDGGCSTGGASGLAGIALLGAIGLVAKRRRGLRRA